MKTHCAALILSLLMLSILCLGCSLRVRGTGNAQADNVEFEFNQSKVTTGPAQL